MDCPTTTINATDSPAHSAARSLLVRGATIGRYVILDKIGVGGMGVVYSAYDPELDRKLAVKLLSVTDDANATRSRRLLREAQAMAKLTHRNVITVHDVGTVDEQVFVAMEFIDGTTLSAWSRGERTWREVLDKFIAAGHGLQAAHDAGLVHRDFKPDNVMVGHDGRVIVMDFGLARAAVAEGAVDPSDSAVIHGTVDAPTGLEATVTAAGAVLGTPAFMSPEQHEGRPTDARSDQFAFCVALYSKLYGQAPFKGTELTALAVNVCCGNLVEPPANAAVPNWLRSAVLRGLCVDPDQRHPDMRALLALLEADHSPPKKRWLAIAAALGLASIGVVAGTALDGQERPCADAGERLSKVWNDDRVEALHSAFADTGLAFAEGAWPAVQGAVDEYAQTLTAGYADACEATHVRQEQSEVMLDRRVACLSYGRAELSALLDLLQAGDPIAVENALSAVQGLPAMGHCADPAHLAEEVQGPDVAIAAQVQWLEQEVAAVAAMERAGLMKDGLARGQELVRQASALQYAPLHAEALLHLAGFHRGLRDMEQAERSYREALAVALRGRADRTAATAAVDLVAVVGERPERADEAEAWAELAAALLGRRGDDPMTEAKLQSFRAGILRAQGRLREASVALEQAIAQTERAHGPGDARVADRCNELADVLVALGEPERARTQYERALRIDEATLGADHPGSAPLLHALGDLVLVAGDVELALTYHQRGLKIREEVPGDGGIDLVASLRASGRALASVDRRAPAQALLRRATSTAEQGLGRTHPVTIRALLDQAEAASKAGEAVELLEDALSRRTQGAAPTTAISARMRRVDAFMGTRSDDGPDEATLRLALTAARAQAESSSAD